MQILVFTLNAIVVYLVVDSILRAVERRRGEVLKQRQVLFFVIFLALILATSAILKVMFGG